MAKLTIQDLAKVLVDKNGLSQQEAETFVTAIFDVVQNGIRRDRLVKVKGLGTFKVIDVDARESINVNTGERVLINGHGKITFTPDATMKELVNKPFSGFETVLLNEGVEFDDMTTAETTTEEESITVENSADIEEPAPQAEEEPAPQVKEEPAPQVKEEPAPQVEEPVLQVIEEPAPQVIEETAPQVEEEPAPQVEEKVAPQVKKVVAAPKKKVVKKEEEHPQPESVEETVEEESTPWWKWLLLAIICLMIGFAGGFYIGKHYDEWCGACEVDEKQQTEEVKTPLVADSLKKASVPADSLLVDSVKKDSLAKDTVKAKPVEEKKVEAPAPDYAKYDAMDQRVRTGAYVIIGTDQVVQAREGDNIARVSRRYLGEGMSCYVEVYNGCTASTPLKAGQEVKIPKLKLRKSVKKQ